MPRRRDARGHVTLWFAVLVPALLLIIGLIVDGAGKIDAVRAAQSAAASAARAATDAAAADLVAGHSGNSDAYRAARSYLSSAEADGVHGSVQVHGRTVTVATSKTYHTKFLSLAGIGSLTGTGQATADLTPVGPGGP